MATFPNYAKILLSGYKETPDYGVLKTDTDGGIPKQRATRSKPTVTRDVTIQVLSTTNKLLFDQWIASDLMGGVGWFDYADPVDSIVKQAQIVDGKIQWETIGAGIWTTSAQILTVG